MLDAELLEVTDLDMQAFGFDAPVEPTEVKEDDFEEEAEDIQAKCQTGEIWVLGNHRLMCGDTANPDDMSALMGGGKAVMCFTDPPYGVAIGDKNKDLDNISKAGRITENIQGDTLSTEELHDVLVKAMTNIRMNCDDDAVYFVTAPQGGNLGMMMMMMKEAGLEVRHNLVWRKNSATFFWRAGKKRICLERMIFHVWS